MHQTGSLRDGRVTRTRLQLAPARRHRLPLPRGTTPAPAPSGSSSWRRESMAWYTVFKRSRRRKLLLRDLCRWCLQRALGGATTQVVQLAGSWGLHDCFSKTVLWVITAKAGSHATSSLHWRERPAAEIPTSLNPAYCSRASTVKKNSMATPQDHQVNHSGDFQRSTSATQTDNALLGKAIASLRYRSRGQQRCASALEVGGLLANRPTS